MSDAILISTKVSSARVRAAFQRAPERMRQIIGEGVWRGGEEVAREARRLAPSVFATLVNSIKAERISELHAQVSPGVNYAKGVEEGTKPGYTPNLLNLRMYIQASMTRSTGFRWGKGGSLKRQSQDAEIDDRTSALAWYIRAHGTKAKPYMKPAAENKTSRVIDLIREATYRGAAEVMR